MVKEHEIEIARNGEIAALLSYPDNSKKKALKELLKLRGILPSDIDPEKIKDERLQKKYGPL